MAVDQGSESRFLEQYCDMEQAELQDWRGNWDGLSENLSFIHDDMRIVHRVTSKGISTSMATT
jgi:hypothetical protein